MGAVAEFLTEQFKHKDAKPRSVRCFRIAIAAIHHGFEGGLTVSTSPTLTNLIKGAFHERPPERSLVPAWDLSLALGTIADSPYEPMHLLDLPELTRKTVFLVAAASGRRVSKIHALSMKEEHLRFSGGSVSLLPRAGFLAKNQTLDFCPKPIVLPDLRKASGSSDCGPWCPVRALKFYLQKTERLRIRQDGTREDRLFLITVSPFTPAKKSTMARWIIQVIKESLHKKESQLAGSHVRAHDLEIPDGLLGPLQRCFYPGSHGRCRLVVSVHLPVGVPTGPSMCSSDYVSKSSVSSGESTFISFRESPQAERLGEQDSFSW